MFQGILEGWPLRSSVAFWSPLPAACLALPRGENWVCSFHLCRNSHPLLRCECSTLGGSSAPGTLGHKVTEWVDLFLDCAEWCVCLNGSKSGNRTHLPSMGMSDTGCSAHPGQLVYREPLTSWCQCEHLQLLDRESTLDFVQPVPKSNWYPLLSPACKECRPCSW